MCLVRPHTTRRLPFAAAWIALFAFTAPLARAAPADRAAESISILSGRYWSSIEHRSPAALLQEGRLVDDMPSGSEAEARELTREARSLARELAKIDAGALGAEDRLTVDTLRYALQQQAEAETRWWYEFPVTAYTTDDLQYAAQALAANPLKSASERAAYVRLLNAYGARLVATRARLDAQRRRGIRPPAPAAAIAVRYFVALKDVIAGFGADIEARGAALPRSERSALQSAVRASITTRIEPARRALVGRLEADARSGPTTVGLSQYPGGKDMYRSLVRYHTSLDLSPEEVFAYGQQRLAEINGEIDSLLGQLGVPGGRGNLRAYLKSETRFLARTPDDVVARYRAAIARIQPHIAEYFSLVPTAQYDVARLDPAAEPGMTFGYYSEPRPSRPTGIYYFNGSNLEERSLIFAAGIIYHELVPGHHFQVALQLENAGLPPFRRLPAEYSVTAYLEGWAEYAAGLAGEMGLLADPYDRLGRLLLDEFLTTRLVVDPGLNYFGWTLEQAREFMRNNTTQSDTEIASETLRYSTAIPGQALGYKVGQRTILELREFARQHRGESFDIREFHAEILGHGALPLSALKAHIERHYAP